MIEKCEKNMPYTCPYCHQAFKMFGSYTQHLSKFHKDSPHYACSYCCQVFPSSKARFLHEKECNLNPKIKLYHQITPLTGIAQAILDGTKPAGEIHGMFQDAEGMHAIVIPYPPKLSKEKQKAVDTAAKVREL